MIPFVPAATDTADTFKLILGCGALGVFLLFKSLRRQRRARQVQDTARSKSATAAQGLAELEGFAWSAGEPVRGADGLEAVYYAFKIQREETRGSGKNRRTVWVDVWTHAPETMGYLVDATGLTLIAFHEAELDLDGERTRNWSSLSEAEQARILGFVGGALSDFPPSRGFIGSLFGSKFRVIERTVGLGSPLYASGDFRAVENAPVMTKAPGLTAFAQRVFDLPARSTRDLTRLLDVNGDGKISAEELRLGYAAAGRSARMTVLRGAVENEFGLHGELAKTAAHGLFVADTFEEQLTARLQKGFWLWFPAGAALCAFALVSAVAQFSPYLGRNPAGGADVAHMRAACLAGDRPVCRDLVDHRAAYGLDEASVVAFRRRLGDAR